MTRHFLPPTAAFLLFAGLTAGAGFASAEPATPVTVAVRLFNDPAVPASAVAKAKETVAEICRRAGLEIVWTDSTEPFVPSVKAAEGSIRELRMTIIPNATRGAEVGGYARMTERFAVVFFGMAKEVAARSGMSAGRVLGYLMAHEVGHLLLPSGSHSPSGIMRAVWAGSEYCDASQGHLAFTSEQGLVMRTRLMH